MKKFLAVFHAIVIAVLISSLAIPPHFASAASLYSTIQFRRGTAAQWTAADNVLASGEPGYETDTGNWKIGDGLTHWTNLKYQPYRMPATIVGSFTGDNTGNITGFDNITATTRVRAPSIGSASYTDNGYFKNIFGDNTGNITGFDNLTLNGTARVADLIAKGPRKDIRAYFVGSDNTAAQNTTGMTDAIAALYPGDTLYIPIEFFVASAPVINVANVTVTGGGKIKATAKNDYGLRIAADNVTVTGITVQGFGKDDGGTSSGRGGIHITNGNKNCRVVNNTVIAASGTGIVDDGDENIVSGNFILETGEHGIYSSSAIRSIYSNNYIKDAGKNGALTGMQGYGIKIDGATDSIYEGNVIVDPQYFGIQYAGTSTRNIVRGNTIRMTASTSHEGIDVSGGTAKDNKIQGNMIYQANAYAGIGAENGNSVRTDISGNTVVMAANSNGISVRGDRDTVAGNTLIANTAITAAAIIANAVALYPVIKNNMIVSGDNTWARGIESVAANSNVRAEGNVITATNKYLVSAKNRDVYLSDRQGIDNVTTTDNTVTILYTFAVAASAKYMITAEVYGTSSDNNAAYIISGLFKTDSGEAPTQVGSTTSISAIESNSGWNCAFAVDSSGYIYVKVTGGAGETVNWKIVSFEWTKT